MGDWFCELLAGSLGSRLACILLSLSQIRLVSALFVAHELLDPARDALIGLMLPE